MDILGGYRNDISVELDRKKIEAAGLDMGQVMQRISSSFSHGTVGDVYGTDGKMSVSLDTGLNNIDSVKNLPIENAQGDKVYLRDIANIRSGPMDIKAYYSFQEKNSIDSSASGSQDRNSSDTVFIGVAKLKGTNSVIVVDDVL